uniref:CCHC-type domain-containing protein n=1 Tax=Neolamprologus brichardi TaxID=32507 RepID=A0A3Q4I9Q8_NEOBR
DETKSCFECRSLHDSRNTGLIQKKGRGMHSGRARGRGRATHTPNSGLSTTCWECGKKGRLARDSMDNNL